MNKVTRHVPVLLKEVLSTISPKAGGVYVDATLGGGGHFFSLLNAIPENTNPRSVYIGFDHDESAVRRIIRQIEVDFKERFTNTRENVYELTTPSKRILLINKNFETLSEELALSKIYKVDGIIADLGTSQDQLDDLTRGFSFLETGSLDMRMDSKLQIKASDLLKILTRQELIKLFNNLADIKGKEGEWIVEEIMKAREHGDIKTTDELKKIITRAVPLKSVGSRTKGIRNRRNLEARVFQALRIAVNHELDSLQQFLPQAFETLEAFGVLVVISFHSGEDRIVKHYVRSLVEQEVADYVHKLVRPSISEIKYNAKSSSARLRAIRKIK